MYIHEKVFYLEEPCDTRPKETTGTCGWFSCAEWRGPTDCVNGKCLCAENHFTEDGEKCISCGEGIKNINMVPSEF